MADTNEVGPVYGVPLIDSLPIGGGMLQAMPMRSDLTCVRRLSERVPAGYEVLLKHYREKCDEVERLKGKIREVINGKFEVTCLQESIGDLNERK